MRFGIIVMLMLSLITFASAEEVDLQNAGTTFKITAQGTGFYEVEFNLDKFQVEEVISKGLNYQKISHPEAGYLLEKGKAELPVFGTMLAIPPQSEVSCEVLVEEKQVLPNYRIFPAQEKGTPEEYSSLFLSQEYGKNAIYPQKKYTIDIAEMRDYRVANIKLLPFGYNGAEQKLTVSQKIKVRINYTNPQQAIDFKLKPKVSRSFEKLYSSLFLNYEQMRDRNPVYQKPCLVIIYKENPLTLSKLEELAQWKREKGFEVHLTPLIEAGSTNIGVLAYLQNAYDTWENPPEYLIMAGCTGLQATFVPFWDHNGVKTDYSYSLLQGNDSVGDLFVGRLPFNDEIELNNNISKIFQVERDPSSLNSEYFEKYLLVGSTQGNVLSCIDVNIAVKDMIKSKYPEATFSEIYDLNLTSDQFIMALNSGKILFNYRGYQNMNGFNNSVITVTNLNMPVYGSFMTSTTSMYGYAQGIAEKFVNLGSTVGTKGGVSVLASTYDSHTSFFNCLSQSAAAGIFKYDLENWGQTALYSRMYMWNLYSGDEEALLNLYGLTLIGDPSTDAIKGPLQGLQVNHPVTLHLGVNSFVVSVTDSLSMPMENAWVSVLGDSGQVCNSGMTDASGSIILPTPADANDNIKLTVSKSGFYPYRGLVEIDSAGTAVVDTIMIDDDQIGGTQGNGDGLLNPGELCYLKFPLKNTTNGLLNNVTLQVTSDDSFIELSGNTVTYPPLAPGLTAQSGASTIMAISGNCPDQHIITLSLLISTPTGQRIELVQLEVKGIALELQSIVVNDNNNGHLDSGETVFLTPSLKNIGYLVANDINLTLRSLSNSIIVQDSLVWAGDFEVQETLDFSNAFQVSAYPTLVAGEIVEMQLVYSNLSGYMEFETFNLVIGQTNAGSQTGPDAYGYMCLENSDTQFADHPEYNWIELFPDLGTDLLLYDIGENNDVTTTVDLPFTFRFYGIDYSQISICSNGWVSFGETDQTTYRNYPLPGPMGPSPIIACLWTDLITGATGNPNYKVMCYYDSLAHQYIVEWKTRSINQNYNEFFELILYDPEFDNSIGDEGQFKIQYQNINLNVTSTDSFHDKRPTVGIQNQTADVGLLVGYNWGNPSTMHTIANGTALLFKAVNSGTEQNLLFPGDLVLTDDSSDGIISPGETVRIGIPLTNYSNQVFTNIQTTLNCSNPHVSILNAISNYSNLTQGNTGYNMTDFVIRVNPDYPLTDTLRLVMNIQSNMGTQSLTFEYHVGNTVIDFLGILMAENTGNMNLSIDPGETVTLGINLTSIAGFNCRNIKLRLESIAGYDLSADTLYYGEIQQNTVVQKTVNLSLSSTLQPGDLGQIPLTIYENDTVIGNTFLSILIGGNEYQCGVKMSGPVTISGTDGDYRSVKVQGRGLQTTPDANGNYSMLLPLGLCANFSATSPYYYAPSYLNLNLIYGSNCSNINFSLDKLNSPQNLTLAQAGNTVVLDWDLPNSATRGVNSRKVPVNLRPTIQRYVIYIKNNAGLIQQVDSTTATTISRNLTSSGIHKFWVRARYSEGLGASSDTVSIVYNNLPPQITEFSPASDSLTCSSGTVIPFQVSAEDLNSPYTVAWSVNNVAVGTGGSDYSHTFNYSGLYEVRAAVSDFEYSVTKNWYVYVTLANNDVDAVACNKLWQNSPNPFNPETTIRFAIKKQTKVWLGVYNIKGQMVKILQNGTLSAGQHAINWNGKDKNGKKVGSGIYFYKIVTLEFREVRKCLLLK